MALAGNMCITTAKAAVWLSTGSSAMLSEAIHSLVDSGNQALLLVGLMDANNKADKKHPYGYGKSIYFWSLVSALGTFWGGACVSMWTSTVDILNPKVSPSMLSHHTYTYTHTHTHTYIHTHTHTHTHTFGHPPNNAILTSQTHARVLLRNG
jgi:divalent metal cation (Fe/Co/Zn/Cd) transporter